MNKDTRLLFEAYNKSKIGYTPVNSDYIYFLDDEELYQTNPMKRIGVGDKYLKQAFPNGYKKVRVTVGEEIHDIVPGNTIDLGTQSDKLFVVDDTFPEESSFPALISTSSENAEETDDQDYEDELDKKEAYKASLLRDDEDEDAESKKPDISKPLNTRSAIRFIDNKATEMFKKIDPHGQIVLGSDTKPFWYDNGVLKALVIVVTHARGATGPQRSGVQPQKYMKVTITGEPSTGGDPVARIINACVKEYLNDWRAGAERF